MIMQAASTGEEVSRRDLSEADSDGVKISPEVGSRLAAPMA
jgi:hypothetical protein